MDKSPPIFPQPPAASPTAAADPRLQPTPDYGLLGPGSDIANGQVAAGGDARTKSVRAVLGPAAAVAVGGLLAALWVSVGSARGTWGHLAPTLSSANRPALSTPKERRQRARPKPQKQGRDTPRTRGRKSRWRGRRSNFDARR